MVLPSSPYNSHVPPPSSGGGAYPGRQSPQQPPQDPRYAQQGAYPPPAAHGGNSAGGNGGGYPGYYPPGHFQQPNQPQPSQGGGWSTTKKIVAGGVAAGVVLVGGAAVAVGGALTPSGTHPYDVLPAGALVYGELDADPSASQKTAFLQIQDRLEEFGISGGEDIDAQEALSGPLEADYATQIEPWLGDRIGVGAYANPDSPEGLSGYIVYQIGDKKALEAVKDDLGVESVIVDDYLVVAAVPEDGITESHFDNRLIDDKQFKSALNEIGKDNVAVIWTDLGGLQKANAEGTLGTDDYGVNPDVALPEDEPVVTGSLITGLHLESNVVEVRAKTVDLTLDGEPLKVETEKGDLTKDLGALPASSTVAAGLGGVDTLFKSMWDLYPSEREDIANQMDEVYGISLPDEIARITGTTITGAAIYNGPEDYGYVVSARGADVSVWEQIIADASGQQVSAREVDGKVMVIEGDFSGDATLASNPDFKAALPDLGDAHYAAFVSLNPLMDAYQGMYSYSYEDESYDERASADEYGSVGFTGKIDDGDLDLRLRWVLP